jgi:hypothetical protein
MQNVFSKILNKFASMTDEIPLFRLHVSNTAINFHDNYICSVLEFDGIVYEAISNNLLENDYDNLNLLLHQRPVRKQAVYHLILIYSVEKQSFLRTLNLQINFVKVLLINI